MSRELTLSFLGDRRYIQGGTLFERLISAYPNARAITFKIGEVICTDRVRVELNGDNSVRPSATLFLTDCYDAPVQLSVYPLPGSRKPMREPYDEASIVEAAHFTGDSVAGGPRPNISPVKTIVALNKALLQRILSPTTPGQWLFSRLDIAVYPEGFKQITVSYRTRQAFAAVLSEISADGQPIGKIIFSWWNKL
jgi:hypothetical protein